MTALVHTSYHKCLTVYYERVMQVLLRRFGGYRHFKSELEPFYESQGRYRVTSVNNHALDLDRLGDYRISRFVRDPRDLVVSGYFYHRRGAEPWCRFENPTDADWIRVNGRVPVGLRPGESLQSFLERVDEEEGLLAELDFRDGHFTSMREWPASDPRIRMWRYEEILGNEERVFAEVFEHYELPRLLRAYGLRLARRFKASNVLTTTAHVRDPSPGQWRELFTPRVSAAFDERYGDLPALLGYA